MYSDYTLVLPAFTIGANAYDAIGRVTKHFGKKVVIIGGKTALSKAKQPLLHTSLSRRLLPTAHLLRQLLLCTKRTNHLPAIIICRSRQFIRLLI